MTDSKGLSRLLIAVLLVLFGLSAALAARAQDVPAPSPVPSPIVIVDDASYAPFSFLDGDGRPAGITIDIWTLWSRKTGIPLDVRLLHWNEVLAAVQNGEADAVGALFRTEERDKVFDFSSAFHALTTGLFFHEQIHGIKGVADLHGFPIGVVSGDSGEELILSRYPQSQLRPYANIEDMVSAAVRGEVKVFIADSVVARFYLAKHDQEGVIREAAQPVAANLLHVAVRKGNQPLLAAIQEGFGRITEGEIKAIVDAWTGQSVLVRIPWREIGLSSGALAVLIGLIVCWNLQLRRSVRTSLAEVEQRNRQLRDSETRLRTFFDLAPFSCMVNDLQGRFRMVNRAFCQRIGLAEENIIGRTGEELGLFANPDVTAGMIDQLLRSGEVIQREMIYRSANGLRHALYSSRLMELDGERLILTSAVDIHDRIVAEAALRESEERFSKAFALSPAPMVISDPLTGRFIDVNERWLRMLEHTREETIGRTSYELGIWENPGVRDRMGRKMLATGSFRDEPIRFITKSGRIRDALWSAERINLGGTEVMLSLIYDFTERKKAEDALRESEAFTKVLFHDSRIPLAVLDPTTEQFIDCNRAAARIYGFSRRREVVGKGPMDVSVPIQEDGRPSEVAAAARIAEAVARGAVLFEWRHQRPNGEIWDAEVHLMTFHHRGRQLIQLSLHDITDRKQAEREREKLQQQLVQSQKMESVGRLAGGVAHDFNNMLSVILGHTELALQRTSPDEPLYHRLRAIEEAATRSTDLARQLLAFARKQTVAPKVLDLNATIEGMLNMLRRLIGENIELVWRPGAEIGPVRMDPSQIDQVLVNLCVNARDAVGEVGTITIETGTLVVDEQSAATPADCSPGVYSTLVVSDNGCGMDGETIPHLFEPFFTTKETGKGTGLGLAMVYGIVAQNKGCIDVRSEVGRGSTFTILLPRHQGSVELSPPADSARIAPQRGRETILLVEDGAMLLDMTAAMLELHGYTVLQANSPGEAIRLAREHGQAIDLLITDVIMPEMNGRELARTLQAFLPGLGCLFMSGYTADVIAHHGVLDEDVHFIAKPFTLKDLTARVREALTPPTQADRQSATG